MRKCNPILATPLVERKPTRQLRAERLKDPRAIEEAQALRYRIFSGEYGACLQGADSKLDSDHYDTHCQHIGVRDLHSGALVATTRLLDHGKASTLGGFYSEQEFQLNGLGALQGPILEVGRTCVDPAYRNGATIAVLWSELGEVLNEGGYRYLIGCASVSLQDGGVQASTIMRQLRARELYSDALTAVPRLPLPALQQPVPENLSVKMPPLLAAYLRLGARVCGEPCWDPNFKSADLFILLERSQLAARYARHFKMAV